MLFSIKLMFTLALLALAGGAILVGSKKWTWVMKLIFGKERVQTTGTNTLALYLYVAAAVFIVLAILVIT